MNTTETFRISSYLKDIIGRDLVTNEYVAIFELVKNAFDAGATCVDIEFNPRDSTITIVDDGMGMSETDIREKWLFVAYSEKSINSSENYRDKIKPAGQYAGSKGIGRFSCDTLGKHLDLYSKKVGEANITSLNIDWTRFEVSSTQEFKDINVSISQVENFPNIHNTDTPGEHGTVLVIKETRHFWDTESIRRLRKDLAKLIDPFGTTNNVKVSTWLLDGATSIDRDVDGPVGNQIAELLFEKTSRIHVVLNEGFIATSLFDRGRKIYEVREKSPYDELGDCRVEGHIFFLNRAAKQTFTIRMGVRPIDFGSVFLFLNNFRIFPIGEEFDDTLGLNRRKQQGQSRYLGTRDIIGRIDVSARPKMFREVSSRDAGLVEDARSRSLYEAIRKHMIFRLERYVVGVNWKDRLDQNKEGSEGLENDMARERILSVVGSLARAKDIEIIYYDEEIVRVPDDPDHITDEALKAMSEVAASKGNVTLLRQIEDAKNRISELRISREEAQRVAKHAIAEQKRTDARIAALEKQAAFLGSSLDVDVERVQLLMHQATIHLGHIRSAISNSAHEIRVLLDRASVNHGAEDIDDIDDLLASVRQSARRVSSSVAGANLSSERLGTVLSFAPNIRIDLQTDKVHGDLLRFLDEYFNVRLVDIQGMPNAIFEATELILDREFSPVDIAVVIDNLVDNARKAKANRIDFKVQRKGSSSVAIHVSDDGLGIDDRKVDPTKIFERGYSGSADGTGLGLYSVRHIIQGMNGSIDLIGDGSRADFEIIIPGRSA